MTDTQTLTDAILAEDARLHRLIRKETDDAKRRLADRDGDTSALPALIAALERIGRQTDPTTPAARLRARRAAITDAIDQKMACAAATTKRASTRMGKVGATAERNCPHANSAITASNRRRRSKREANTISGKESSMTPQA